MDINEIKEKKRELNGKIASLLNCFEDESGVQVSGIGFVRRVSYDELGRDTGKMYIVDVEVKI